jgi:hypothetical protein
MKEFLITFWRWIAVGALLLAVGAMLTVGLGRRRGTRTYRWRMALWTLALALMGGTVFTVASCDSSGRDFVMCYKDTASMDAEQPADTGNPDVPALCYAADVEQPPDVPVLCYLPDIGPQPDVGTVEDSAVPDVPILCYAPRLPDAVVMCYEDVSAIDTVEDSGQQDVLILCYEPLPPDAVEAPDAAENPDSKDETLDIPPMCYFAGSDPPQES